MVPLKGNGVYDGSMPLPPNYAGKGNMTPAKLGNETDGLGSGEMAWLKSREFRGTGRANPLPAGGAPMGAGPDRMQELATAAWYENYFRRGFFGATIELHTLPLVNPDDLKLNRTLYRHRALLKDATVLNSIDVASLYNKYFFGVETVNNGLQFTQGKPRATYDGTELEEGYSSGLFVMEKGPFLRGKIVDNSNVVYTDPLRVQKQSLGYEGVLFKADSDVLPQNEGDRLAFAGLYSKMRALGMFNWVPDGVVLSKLESPSGDRMSSTALDARQAQLFNMAVQGPAICTSWTGETEMACMPMDKVFVVIIADIVWKTGAAAAGVGGRNFAAVKASLEANAADSQTAAEPAVEIQAQQEESDLATEFAEYATAFGQYTTTAGEYGSGATKDRPAPKTSEQAVLDKAAALRNQFVWGPNKKDEPTFEAKWDTAAEALKKGATGVKAYMTNFSLRRVTSSFLSQYSHFRGTPGGESRSRCGLRLGTKGGDDSMSEGGGQYIVGGWCIGTVLDNAASRSAIGQQVRTAPSSMALNVNVNVEFWSGNDLYDAYMDVEGTVLPRSRKRSGAAVLPGASRMEAGRVAKAQRVAAAAPPP